MGNLIRVGESVPAPNPWESVRCAGTAISGVALAYAAISTNPGGIMANSLTLGAVATGAGLALAASKDSIEPDELEEARAVDDMLKREAANMKAEAIDAWKNEGNLMKFMCGERPSNEWIDAWVRMNFGSGQPALPPSSTQEFAPQFATPPAYDEYEPEEDEYEPAPMMQAQAQVHQPMTMMAQPTIATGALASRFRQQEDPIHVDPIAAKYGKTIASITDMHSPHSKPRHLAFLAVTQCGKTTTLGAVSYALAERYPGSVFVALDGKNSEWAPFYSSTVYPGLLSTYNPKAVIQFLRDAGEELEDRVSRKAKNESRLFVILDEWNSVRDELKAFNVEMCSEADLIVNALVLRGLEYGIHVIIVCQEVNCSKLGFTDAGRGNVHFLALGRSGDKTMVDLLLSGEQILKSKFQREHLQQDFLKVWNDTSRPEMSPVLVDSRAYTAEALPNFSGMIQLVKKDAPPPTRSTPIAPAQSAPPRSPQPRPMLQLAPSQQGGIMDDLPTASELEPLPTVASHTYQFEGMQPVTMKEPPILRVLNERDNVRAIVRALIDWGGTAESRKVQQQRQCTALRTPSGNPYNAEMIARYMAFLAENYPEYFAFDGKTKTLTATDQEVLTWQLRK